MLPYLIGLLVALLAGVTVYRLTLGVRFRRSKRQAQLEILAGQAAVPEVVASRQPRTLGDRLKAAGMDLGERAETAFTLLRVTAAVLGAAAVLFLGLPPALAVLAAVGGYVVPQLWLNGQTQRRARQIEKELPDALGDLVALLRVTPALRNALEQTRALVAQTNPTSPLAQELQWTLEDFQAGEASAFKKLAERAASPALAMLAFSLAIFARSGGDYLDALEAQANGVRQTLEARGSAQAEAADAMMTVKVIPAILILILVMFMQDPFFRAFYFTQFGQLILLGVLGCMFVGYRVVQGMVAEVA